ncbi:hypothetical protein [Spiroplasma platyhelix]|uniref:Transmembrane protein n=1 Tax=Spiroplasma platyhelix PALS-1 TaxID=1276218 RepID=A0A846U1D8_9MOLU|nr:hypothetical protein [Spiroplasma platyhelix]MBE4704253.1 hypothetical protein [Spiroplasma platyhelix PALS-1]NKE38626.1 hypothetical protein [Spiroplasma platyhelix PALS-1]UJB28837.1 hypothetical protein SPLAT_v1c00700 [Spiroplasma platyhelix PALS-1]
MKKIFLHFKKSSVNQKEPFLPYEDKVKVAYFSYSGLFWFLGLLVYIFSLFLIINLAKNGKYQITSDINEINFFFTPILNLILVTASWVLLLIAPKRAYKSPKHSSILFYCSFWFLVISVMLNGQVQLTYMEVYAHETLYHWVNIVFAKIVILLSVFALFGIQIFFWTMRRKFAFMPTDYEIYTQRSIDKKAKKAEKQLKKQNAKLANKKS